MAEESTEAAIASLRQYVRSSADELTAQRAFLMTLAWQMEHAGLLGDAFRGTLANSATAMEHISSSAAKQLREMIETYPILFTTEKPLPAWLKGVIEGGKPSPEKPDETSE